jgi:hypothetical protein
MHRMNVLCVVFCLLGGAGAQELTPPKPAKELAKFERMVGEWNGKGVSRKSADAPATPWTATLSFRKTLDGFFYEEDLTVDFGAAVPTPLQIKEIVGWDAENQRYVKYIVSNGGEGVSVDVHWLDDNTFIELHRGLDSQGLPSIGRGTTKLSADGFAYTSEGCSGGGDFFVHAEGKFTRADGAAGGKIVEASFMDAAPAAPLGKASRLIGKWRIAGTLVMAPGMPEMAIGGIETTTPIWGGTVLQSTVLGDADPTSGYAYRSIGFIVYSRYKGCLQSIMADNMGMCGMMDCRFEGDDLIFTGAGPMMGKPSAQRSVIHLDQSGITRATTHLLSGSAPPVKSFDATYTRAK